MNLNQLYNLMSPEERKRWFFFLLEIVLFYGDGDTWFATSLLPDEPAGLINGDYHWCEDLNRRVPGGRARIAWAWLKSVWGKMEAKAAEDKKICGALSDGDPDDEEYPPVRCTCKPGHDGDHMGGTRGGTISWSRT